MAEQIPLNIGNGFYVSESLPISSQLCQNLYPNYAETDSISPAQLFPTPGLIERANTGATDINRGGNIMDGISYFVNGPTLYSFNQTFDAFGNPAYSTTNLGTIAGSGIVSIANNGTQLCIVVPGTATAYIYTVAGGLALITDGGFIPTPTASLVNMVLFVDGYFVFMADNSVFFHSALNDGTSYTATDFGIAYDARGEIVGGHVHSEQLYIFGSTSGKAYQNVGGAGFVFQEITGLSFTKGLAARFSIIETAGTFTMIGQGVNESPKIYQFTGNDFVPVSTTAIEFALQQNYTTQVQDAFGLSYSFRGAEFAIWSLNGLTIGYDAKASRLAGKQIWHQRFSSDLQGKERWRVNSLVTAYGRLFCGDSESGKIGELDYDTRTEYGINIIRKFALPSVHNDEQTVFHECLKIVGEFGQGLDGGQAKIGMEYSDDGKLYKSIRYRECGYLGQNGTVCQWDNLGSTDRFRIYRFTMTDPVKWIIHKALLYIDA